MIKALVATLSILVMLAIPAHATPPTTMTMFVGEARVLSLSPSRIAIGNGKVISASSVANNQMLVLAETSGTSTLHVWLKGGGEKIMTVQVREANLAATLEDINRLLANVQNVRARVAGARIVLEGDMVSDINQERAQSIQKMFPEQVVNFVGKVGWEKMVYLDVKVLELTTKGSRDLGIRWDSNVNGPHAGVIADFYSNPTFRYLPPAGSSGLDIAEGAVANKIWPPKGFINLTSLITSRINLLVQDGEAQVLAAPSLSTRSGSKAHFVAGGEIPLPSVDALGRTSVEMKEYGVILDVTPVTDESGAIYAKVDVEVSSIDRSVTVLGVPGLLKRKSTAEFNSRDGETAVLNGMYSYEGARDSQKVPGAAQIPILGGLFRNKATVSATREVAIMITPRLVQATPNPAAGPADVNKQKLHEFDKALRDNQLGPKPPAPLTMTE